MKKILVGVLWCIIFYLCLNVPFALLLGKISDSPAEAFELGVRLGNELRFGFFLISLAAAAYGVSNHILPGAR
jgi:hypothetical protein